MDTVFSVIGAITGLVSLIGLVYQLGYRNANVDGKIEKMEKTLEKWNLGEIGTQVKTLWDIYVLDALRNRPDLASHSSSLTINPKGEDMLPDDVKKALREFQPCDQDMDSASWLVVKCLGVERIENLSKNIDLSYQETVALLAVYYQKYHPECPPVKGTCPP